MKITIRNKKIVLSTHSLIYSSPQALRDYLRKEGCEKLLYVSHALIIEDGKNDEPSYYEVSYRNKVEAKKEAHFNFEKLTFSAFYETYLTIKWVLSSSGKYDLFVGVDCLNAFQGLVLKVLGKVKKVTYYTIDYYPVRFDSSFLNWIYHTLDKLCVYFADETWNVSSSMVKARKKHNNMDKNIFPRQFTVPIGVWFDRAPRKPFSQIKKTSLVFVGHLKRYMGVDLAVRGLARVVKKIPSAHLHIIGGGEAEEELKALVKKLHLTNNVTFYGWIKNRQKLEQIMSTGAVGIAPFNPYLLDDKVKNADPAKIKDYMLLGMPVIVTDAIASTTKKNIERKKCGLVINYDEKEFVDAVMQFMLKEGSLKQYRHNALDYIKQFDYNAIFDECLTRTFSQHENKL